MLQYVEDLFRAWARWRIPTVSASTLDCISSGELAKRLGEVDESAVRKLERAGRLFCVFYERRPQTCFPAYQASPGIAGAPLAAVLEAFRGHGRAEVHLFLTSQDEAFGSLCAVEVLLGGVVRRNRRLLAFVQHLLCAPPEERLDAVLVAARLHIEARNSW